MQQRCNRKKITVFAFRSVSYEARGLVAELARTAVRAEIRARVRDGLPPQNAFSRLSLALAETKKKIQLKKYSKKDTKKKSKASAVAQVLMSDLLQLCCSSVAALLHTC